MNLVCVKKDKILIFSCFFICFLNITEYFQIMYVIDLIKTYLNQNFIAKDNFFEVEIKIINCID